MKIFKFWCAEIKHTFAEIVVFIILIFITRTGESELTRLNVLKMTVDVLLACVITRKFVLERNVAIFVAIIFSIVSILKIRPEYEFILLICIAIGSMIIICLHYFNTNNRISQVEESNIFHFTKDVSQHWSEKNRLGVFEKYTYFPEKGVINIEKGLVKKLFVNVSTRNVTIRIEQTVFQRIIGLCDVYFSNTYNGKLREEILHNIKIKSALALKDMM